MKGLFMSAAVISGVLFFGTAGFAQEHDLDPVFQKIRFDVNNVQSVKSVFSEGDRYSFSRMNLDLDQLQRDYAVCHCNQGVRDETAGMDVIDTLQRAVHDTRIPGRDREILQEDLNLLRGTSYSDTQVYAR